MKPFDNYKNPIDGARTEILSGTSALHMEPSPKEDKVGNGWLSDTDNMVAHSLEHFYQAYQLLADAYKEHGRLERGTWKKVTDLMRKIKDKEISHIDEIISELDKIADFIWPE